LTTSHFFFIINTNFYVFFIQKIDFVYTNQMTRAKELNEIIFVFW